ncbi:MAG: hypothetical protein SGILL_003938 [Bacillariaceae sp.]
MGRKAEIETLGERLRKEVVDSTEQPDLERTEDLLKQLQKYPKLPMSVLEETKIGKTMSKCVKTLKRHKRTSPDKNGLESVAVLAEKLLTQWKEAAAKEEASKEKKAEQEADESQGLPTNAKQYHFRLLKQKKELYKDPPALPPDQIVLEKEFCAQPKRDKKTGEFTFACGKNKDIQQILRDFHPNRSPEEIMRAGSFGGTYFRPITSAVTNQSYNASDVLRDSVDPKWISGLNKKTLLISSTYRASVNKYGVKCGGSLGMWESSGWISDSDPYGWFQWYCRFYQGRRCSDDVRQIQRWCKSAGPKGRFRSQLCNKILAAHTKPDDIRISPVIRQTLLHWGLEITIDVLAKHKKRVSK